MEDPKKFAAITNIVINVATGSVGILYLITGYTNKNVVLLLFGLTHWMYLGIMITYQRHINSLSDILENVFKDIRNTFKNK